MSFVMCSRSLGVIAAFGLAACTHGRIPGASRGTPAVTGGPPAEAPSGARVANRPKTGLEVIGWMRRAHPSRELRTLSFDITTVEYKGEQQTERESRGYAALPGRLRVDVLPTSTRAGYVRNRQRLSVFNRGRRVATSNRVDLATLLAYDVFAQSIDTTIMWLDSAKIRFGLLRRDFLNGRAVWVVGAERGDDTSPQFWVDAERWRVVRVIQPDTKNRVVDARFTDYTELLNVPVPQRIVLYMDGELVQEQRMANLAANPVIPTRVFDLARWRRMSAGD
jgi:hypothetical protein